MTISAARVSARPPARRSCGKTSAFIRAVHDQREDRCSQAGDDVDVFRCPCGTGATSRYPRGARPYRGVMLVVARSLNEGQPARIQALVISRDLARRCYIRPLLLARMQ